MADPSSTAPQNPDPMRRLEEVVARLRDPQGGCPWDLEQTHQSLVPYVLEEAHEVADAIRYGDDSHLKEELGDLLLQVVLHARIAGEDNRFDLNAVAEAISAKLIRRHPHVFADGEASDSEAVRRSWEAIKAAERGEQIPSASPLSDQLAGKVRGQPALAGAMTISKKRPKPASNGTTWLGCGTRCTKSSMSSRKLWRPATRPMPRKNWVICCSPW